MRLPLSLAVCALAACAQDSGSKSSRLLAVPPGSDGHAEIPVTYVRGARPGPTLAVIAGNHGFEYAPILASQTLREQLDPSRIAGTVFLVHAANPPSFFERTIYFTPGDHKNLNRVYPGRPDGTISERIAWTITRQIIERCDFLLDLHCGDGNESLRPYVYQAVTGNSAIDARIEKLALASGIDHIVLDRGRPTDPGASVYCSTTAITRGKPALTVESGYLGSTDPESSSRLVAGVENVLRHLKILDGAPAYVRNPVRLDPATVLDSPATGILYPQVERGQQVRKGTRLARVTDFFGNTLAEIKAPFGGVILYIVATPPIRKGQPVAFLGAPKKVDSPHSPSRPPGR
jgi:hypothetical protein